MIVYALDPNFLSDEVYNLIRARQDQGTLPKGRDWIVGLYWIRRFYEEGAGNNYARLLGNNNQVITAIFKQWRLGKAPNLADFIVQCPLVSTANNAGVDSQLTTGIRFLLGELRLGFGDDELTAAVERLEQLPDHSKGQIAAAEKYPEDFKAVLNTLLTGRGEGWLARFVNHPLRCEILEPQWGLYLNGNHRDVALCVYTNSGTVRISQNGQNLELRSNEQGRAIAPVNNLLKAGINPNESFLISGQNFPALDTSTVAFARFRQNSTFCPFLRLDPNVQIQAARLWAFLSAGNWEFRLGDSVPTTPEKFAIRGFGNLHKLDFTDIDRAQSKMLKLNGTGVIQIGAAPALEVIGADPWVRSLDEPETRFVFGDRVKLGLTDLPTDPSKWSCTTGAEICWEDQQPILQCDGEYGKKIAVSVNVGRLYPIRLVIRFIYPEMREAMLQEIEWRRNEIYWKPLPSNNPEFPVAVAQSGLVRGELTQGTETVRVWVPSKKPHFWFSLGYDDGQTDDPLHLDSLNALRQRKLHIYIPPGIHHVLWGGEPWLDCEGPGYWEERMFGIDSEWPLLEQSSRLELHDNLNEQTPLAEIADLNLPNEERAPTMPEATDDPEFERFLGEQFALSELASRMQNLRFRRMAWPMEWSWSGQQLRDRIEDNLYEICRRVNPGLTRQQNRDLFPTLNSLREISKGNQSDSIWIPLSAFRINNTAQATEFFSLAEIRQVSGRPGIAILIFDHFQRGKRELEVCFNYSQNTSFTRPNQQRARQWHFHIWDDGQTIPEWLLNESQRNTMPQLTTVDQQLASEVFKSAIEYSRCLVATHADQRLAYAFLEISSQFEQIAQHRAICFQAAVMCRLHARMEAHRDKLDRNDALLRLSHSRFTAWLRHLSRDICASESTRETFNSDLIAVDWALAWFHELI